MEINFDSDKNETTIKKCRKYKGTPEEDNIGELDEEFFRNARPAAEALPEIFGEEVAAELRDRRGPGRPKQEVTKVFTRLRLDPDILAAFKKGGRGWQTRINEALREWVAEHHPD
jgi:uncharacterized protein (DUF4415 family)